MEFARAEHIAGVCGWVKNLKPEKEVPGTIWDRSEKE
jgi:hypothetical protein